MPSTLATQHSHLTGSCVLSGELLSAFALSWLCKLICNISKHMRVILICKDSTSNNQHIYTSFHNCVVMLVGYC